MYINLDRGFNMYKLSLIDKISIILVIIGAVNWGLLGLFNIDLVSLIFGSPVNIVGRMIYILIGIAGIDEIVLAIKSKKLKM
jgi:uncharacterized protein